MKVDAIQQLNADDLVSNSDGIRGSGSFGKVFLCRHTKDLGYVAVKSLTLIGQYDEDTIMKGVKEANMLWSVDHPNVIKTHGYVHCESFYGIVMEYASCKDLTTLILRRKQDIPVPLTLCLRILSEISNGLRCLHSLEPSIVHGDLKLENVLLSDGLQVKIADLGSARHPTTIEIHERKDYGTPGYIAPERYSSRDVKLSSSMDVYSFAVIAYQVITREGIRVDAAREADAMRGNPDQRPGNLDEMEKKEATVNKKVLLVRFNDMIKQCWHTDPTKRWTCEEITENLLQWFDEYMKSTKDPQLEEKVSKQAAGIAVKLKFAPFEEGTTMSLEKCLELELTRKQNAPWVIVTGGQVTKQDVVGFASNEPSKWIEFPSLKQGRCHHCSVIVSIQNKENPKKSDSRLYVLGGTNKSKVLKSVEYLELDKNVTKTGQWKSAPNMHACRFLACSEALQEKIFVLGGKNERDDVLDSIECFSCEAEQWSLIQARLREKRFDFNTFLSNGLIYCCGGLDSKGKVVYPVEKVDPEESFPKVVSISQQDQKFARYSACSVKTDENTVWFIGGLNKQHKSAEPLVASYTIDGSWQPAKINLNMRRCSFAAGMADRTIFAFGGHGLNDKRSSLTTYEQINFNSEGKWSISPLPDKSERNWAGHSMVVWKP